MMFRQSLDFMDQEEDIIYLLVNHCQRSWSVYFSQRFWGHCAGRDATRALALTSLEPENIEKPTLEGIDDLSTLNEWVILIFF